MARGSKQEAAELPKLSPEQAIKRLELRILELEKLDPSTITGFDDPQLADLRTSISTTLADSFGRGSAEFHTFSDAAQFRQSRVINMGGGFGRGSHGDNGVQARQDVAKAKPANIARLRSAIKLLKERLSDSIPLETKAASQQAATQKAAPSRRVFIVHGHDEAAKQSVARFLEQMGFQPIILHEQPNLGRTIIEKIEDHSDVGFAVVLLTPDDECVTPDGNKKRGRQNVILELGYFIGHLGRDRVAALKKGDLELPSDIIGVVYTDFDDRGAWKMDLAKELKGAGYAIEATDATDSSPIRRHSSTKRAHTLRIAGPLSLRKSAIVL